MKLFNLQPAAGSTKERKRVGRGQGSGHGKTAGRGTKGQWARTGGGVRPGFEGGQMPLYRRLPKRGFHNNFKTFYALVQIADLNLFPADSVVDLGLLQEAGLVRKVFAGVKILGTGELAKPLTVQAAAFSQAAREKIETAGGKAEVV